MSDFLSVCVRVCACVCVWESTKATPAVLTVDQMSVLNSSLHWEHHMWVLFNTLCIYSALCLLLVDLRDILTEGRHMSQDDNMCVNESTNCFYKYWQGSQTLPEILSRRQEPRGTEGRGCSAPVWSRPRPHLKKKKKKSLSRYKCWLICLGPGWVSSVLFAGCLKNWHKWSQIITRRWRARISERLVKFFW